MFMRITHFPAPTIVFLEQTRKQMQIAQKFTYQNKVQIFLQTGHDL